MKPMLSATVDADNFDKLRYPLYASPKLDGIRVLIHPERGPVTRSLDPVRNRYLRELLNRPEFVGLDGEIIVGDPTASDVFNKTTSAVMAFDGINDVTYYVFDHFGTPTARYDDRLSSLSRVVYASTAEHFGHPVLHFVSQCRVNCPSDLRTYEEQYERDGFEGVMVRSLDAPYKFGRSTFREHGLMKWKRMSDAEATIVGYEPLYVNNNAPTINALGYQERSASQANLVAVDKLGAFIVRSEKFQTDFKIGSGFDDSQRVEYWKRKENLIGQTVTFVYQQIGTLDAPRFPIFKGFRRD